jgi:hypothetical protein
MEFNIKHKSPEGKYVTVGNQKDGKFGPRYGLRATEYLKALVANAEPGAWINLDGYEKDGGPARSASSSDDVDSVPF